MQEGIEMADERPTRAGAGQPESNSAENGTTERTDAVLDVLLRAGHMQVAAMTSASRFLSDWAQSADRYAQLLGTEICDLIEGRVPSDEAAPRFADAASQYLRELTELPDRAVKHFNEQIAKETRNQGPRTRRARAKD
jgi:hypothetical protein